MFSHICDLFLNKGIYNKKKKNKFIHIIIMLTNLNKHLFYIYTSFITRA